MNESKSRHRRGHFVTKLRKVDVLRVDSPRTTKLYDRTGDEITLETGNKVGDKAELEAALQKWRMVYDVL